jgi:5-(carboxyamino)imidazole ribonucleotide synthase
MEQLVTSDFKLGIIAGGQLGKMLVLAASNWDVKTYIMDKDDHCPASTSCTHFVKGDNTDYDDVVRFGMMVDMITFEIENINIEALKTLKARGKRISPDPLILETIQDKGKQKIFYRENDIPSSAFQLFESKSEIQRAIESKKLNYPFVQKLRTGGYDGRGVAIIRSEEQTNLMLEGPSVVEELVALEKEISVIAARNARGEVRCYPAVEMEFNDHANLVERLVCPASIPKSVEKQAEILATKIANSLDLNGIIAVEFFLIDRDVLLVNEIAPRPHNSGHHTIESNITSQFEQLLRSIFNFPLGSTQLKLPAVMINLLGEEDHFGKVKYEGLTDSMKIEGVKVHLYGKKETKPFRKMGHVTVMDKTIESAKRKSETVKNLLKIKSWQNL